MTWPWAELPLDRVVRLAGPDPEAIGVSLDPLPDGVPAIVTYRPAVVPSSTWVITHVLAELDSAAVSLYPAWLPGAEVIDRPGGAGTAAVRSLAMRAAATTPDFGPFLADLAERSLRRRKAVDARFAPEVRAAGLARVVASSFHRSRSAILVHVPDGLTATAEQSLVAAFEWFTYHGRVGVWLTGAPLHAVDRVGTVEVPHLAGTSETDGEPAGRRVPGECAPPELPAMSFPALTGRPHPASPTEQALEKALAALPWAAGRTWNTTHHFGPLANPVRLDLVWPDEHCVVEVDGPEHCGTEKYEHDRRRDVDLQLAGYAVLRFTNKQVERDLESVLGRIERFIHMRRRERRHEQLHREE